MFDEIKISQVKKLIINALERFAKELDKPIEKVCFWIYTEDQAGTPKLKVLNELKNYKNITFGDLCTIGEKLIYGIMGFNVEQDTGIWIQKFLVKSSVDHKISITVPKYMLIILKGELHAFMYVNNQQTKEISLQYILETK